MIKKAPSPNAVPVPLGVRWTAADHVYEVLEQMVIAGTLKPGDRLTELSLAEQLQVSRTPLRQAVQKLVSKGWIRRASNGAIHVVDVSDQEIEALYAVRGALEEMILCQAAERLDAAGLAQLRELVSRQSQAARAGNAELVSSHGEEFHRALWRISGNLVGAQFLEDVLQRTTRYRRLSFSEPYRFRKGLEQHSALVDALAKGDLERGRGIIRAHIDESRNYVMQAFTEWLKAGDRKPSRAARRPRGSPPAKRRSR